MNVTIHQMLEINSFGGEKNQFQLKEKNAWTISRFRYQYQY